MSIAGKEKTAYTLNPGIREFATHGLGSEPVQLWTQNRHGLKSIAITEAFII